MRILYIFAACVAASLSHFVAWSANRYWVGTSVYVNNFNITADLNQWSLIEDNGTGSWGLSGNGSAILKMDNAAGGYANRLFNVNNGLANLLPLDKINGVVEFQVIALAGANQRFFLQVQEFNSSGTYLGEQTILAPNNTAGYYAVNLSAVIWNPATTQIRFIIAGENYSSQQGTIEFNYFNYSNTVKSWSNASNWSTTSGGPGGATAPGAGDLAIFDGGGASGTHGLCFLDAAVTVAGITMSGFTGTMDLRGFSLTTTGPNTFSTGNIANTGAASSLTLNTSGSTYFAGTSFNVAITGSSTNLYFNGSYFNNAVTLTKTGGSANLSTGNNVFQGALSLTNNAAAALRLATLSRDIFNSTVSVTVGNASAVIDLSYTATGNQYGDHVSITYNAAGTVNFGGGGGTSILAPGKTTAIAGCTGLCGNLSLAGVETGATSQNIIFPSGGSFRTSLASIWNGNLTVSAGTVLLDGATFNGTTSITKTGASNDYSNGGNAFNGTTSIVNSGSGALRMANGTGDAFNGNVTFARFSGILQPAYNGDNIFAGNVTTNSSSSITFGEGGGTVTFSGAAAQALGMVASTAGPVIQKLVINKVSNKLTLSTPLTVGTSVIFTLGIIEASATNYISIDDGAVVSGAKTTSHVDGVVKKAGASDFTFPIGNNGVYRPVTIRALGDPSVFAARYFKTPQNIGSSIDGDLYAISACEYWTLDRESGAGIPLVTLSWQSSQCNSTSYVTDPADMRVAHWNGTLWEDLGAGTITGTAAAGTVTTSLPVESFSPFILASATPDNPLPVELDNFKGIATSSGTVLFWETASENNNAYFTVMRSGNSMDFQPVGNVDGAGTTTTRQFYAFPDSAPLAGVNYYKLRQTDYDKHTKDSDIIAVDMNAVYSESPFLVYPNPAGRQWINFNETTSFRVVNALGQAVAQGSNVQGFDASALHTGIYWVMAGSGKTAKLIIH